MPPPPADKKMARKKAKSGGRGCLGALVWMMTGVFAGLGAAAAVAVYVNQLHLPFADSPTRDSALTPEQSRERSRQEALDFHDTLKQRQALPAVADDEEEAQTPSARKFVWHLQTGAFRARAQAEEMRARLALSGYAAAIRPGKTDNGDIYRVWIGPFDNENDAEENRAKLALEGITDIPLLKSARE